MGCATSSPAQRRYDPEPVVLAKDLLPNESEAIFAENPQDVDDNMKKEIPKAPSTKNIPTAPLTAVEPAGEKNIPIATAPPKQVAFDVPPAAAVANQPRPEVPQETEPPMKRVAVNENNPSSIINKLESVDPNQMINRKIEDYYEVDRTKRIGKGHYASVFMGKSRTTGERVAVKMIEKRLSKTERLALEVNVMRKAGAHPQVVQLLDVFETETQLQLVLELVEGGELFEYLVEHGPYSEATAALHIRDVTRAIAFLHSQNIIHRDLKPENILLTSKDETARIKVADFGLAKLMFADVTRTVCGTWAYCAYEVKKPNGAYDNKCDVWSIGVIAYILLSAYHPFDPQGDATDDEIWHRISQADYNFNDPAWNNVSEQAKDFVSKLLVLDPKKRMSAEEALQHPWLKNVPDSAADAETQPALSPAINDKLASFQTRSRTALNPLQKAAAAMRNRVGSWKSSSTINSSASPTHASSGNNSNGSPSPSWGRRNLVIAAAAAAAAARSARRSGGGVGSGGEESPTKGRGWSMGSGRFKDVAKENAAAESGASNLASQSSSQSPVSSSADPQKQGSEEKSETPPSTSNNFEPSISSPLKMNNFVWQNTGDTLDVPSTPSMALAENTEVKEQSSEKEASGGAATGATKTQRSKNPFDSSREETAEMQPSSPAAVGSGRVASLRVVVTGEEGEEATLGSSDLDTVSDDDEEEQEDDSAFVDGQQDADEAAEQQDDTFVSNRSDNVEGVESFKTAREQSAAGHPIVEDV